MSRQSVLRLRTAVLVVALTGATVRQAYGQGTSTSPPPTQDSQLRLNLGLGAAAGCFLLLGVNENGQDVANALTSLGSQIGNELRAICSPSAVNSASSLGGGLQTLQPVKTVTQFRLARSRIDQRLLKPKPPAKPKGGFVDLSWMQFGAQDRQPGEALPVGASVFGEVEFGTRNRADTSYESGYDSDIKGFTIGADIVRGGFVAGGWFGGTSQEGTFRRFGALLDPTSDPTAIALLAQPAVLSGVCGGLSNAGTFEQNATRLGGFAGWAIGTAGFIDAAFGWTRRGHDYSRSICAIELPGEVTYANGVLSGQTEPVDDIYAGVLRGESTIHETSFSVRAGADAGNAMVTAGPRVIFTLTRASTGAYVETGRSTVANLVDPVFGFPVTRQLGGPIGLELAYDEQSRTSMLLEAGGEIAVHFGQVSPHFSGYWRREFKDDFHLVTAQFAQDRRPNPTVLEFGYDAYDPNALQFGFGVTAISRDRFAARLDISQLVSDTLFSGRMVSVQARVRF